MDRVCESIRAVGEVGISVLQYQWMLLGGLRTEYSPTGRGGARYPRFDMQVAEQMPAAAMDWLGGGVYPTLPDRPLRAEQVWDNLHYFLQRAVPVAEEAGSQAGSPPGRRARTYLHGRCADFGRLGGVARVRQCRAQPQLRAWLLHGHDWHHGGHGRGGGHSPLRQHESGSFLPTSATRAAKCPILTRSFPTRATSTWYKRCGPSPRLALTASSASTTVRASSATTRRQIAPLPSKSVICRAWCRRWKAWGLKPCTLLCAWSTDGTTN